MTWKFIIKTFLLLLSTNLLYAQTDSTAVAADSLKEEKKDKPPLEWSVDGLRIGTDFSYPAWMIFEPDDRRAELSLELNVSNRLFGILEAGYSRIRSVKPPNNFEYINEGFYLRTGLDYNVLHRLLRQDEALVVGVRYGQARFDHQLFYLVNDAYWGIEDIDFNGTPDYARQIEESGMSLSWVEANLGLKVRVWKRFYAGYTFRFQFRLNTQDGEQMKATSVPGFNKTNNGSNIGFGYHIWYQLPF